jgi:hypothetical protein
MKNLTDSIGTDFSLLASIATYIRNDLEVEDTLWKGSPFAWIINLPAGSKGKLGKQLISSWCAAKGLAVDTCKDPGADMLINGHRVEIKFSTLWKSGIYKFQQIRDQNYEYAVCLGVSPFEAHCWAISKSLLKKHVIGHMGQHTGIAGKETSWITVIPNEPPDWLKTCGGTLDQAFIVLKGLSRR